MRVDVDVRELDESVVWAEDCADSEDVTTVEGVVEEDGELIGSVDELLGAARVLGEELGKELEEGDAELICSVDELFGVARVLSEELGTGGTKLDAPNKLLDAVRWLNEEETETDVLLESATPELVPGGTEEKEDIASLLERAPGAEELVKLVIGDVPGGRLETLLELTATGDALDGVRAVVTGNAVMLVDAAGPGSAAISMGLHPCACSSLNTTKNWPAGVTQNEANPNVTVDPSTVQKKGLTGGALNFWSAAVPSSVLVPTNLPPLSRLPASSITKTAASALLLTKKLTPAWSKATYRTARFDFRVTILTAMKNGSPAWMSGGGPAEADAVDGEATIVVKERGLVVASGLDRKLPVEPLAELRPDGPSELLGPPETLEAKDEIPGAVLNPGELLLGAITDEVAILGVGVGPVGGVDNRLVLCRVLCSIGDMAALVLREPDALSVREEITVTVEVAVTMGAGIVMLEKVKDPGSKVIMVDV